MNFVYYPVGGFKRTVDRLHVRPSLKMKNTDFPLFFHIVHNVAVSAVFTRVIQGPQNVPVLSYQLTRLPSIPQMIAGCNDMDSEIVQLFCLLFRKSFPFEDVFTVGNCKVDMVFVLESFQEFRCDFETGRSDDIPDKEDIKSSGQGNLLSKKMCTEYSEKRGKMKERDKLKVKVKVEVEIEINPLITALHAYLS